MRRRCGECWRVWHDLDTPLMRPLGGGLSLSSGGRPKGKGVARPFWSMIQRKHKTRHRTAVTSAPAGSWLGGFHAGARDVRGLLARQDGATDEAERLCLRVGQRGTHALHRSARSARGRRRRRRRCVPEGPMAREPDLPRSTEGEQHDLRQRHAALFGRRSRPSAQEGIRDVGVGALRCELDARVTRNSGRARAICDTSRSGPSPWIFRARRSAPTRCVPVC
jgi:hypothetical protein